MGGGTLAGQALRVAWYRFGVTFRRRWGGYLALAVLIGLAGGIAMGSMAAARRTYSSYPEFLAGTNPSDLVVQPFTTPAYSPGLVRQLGRLPHVRGVAVAVPFNAITLTSRGKLGTVLLAQVQLAATIASPHGLYADQDRVTITSGRRANPLRAERWLPARMPPPCFTFGWGRICGSALSAVPSRARAFPAAGR